MTTVHLGCAADDAFAIPLAMLLYSAAVNAAAQTQLVFHILDGGISRPHRSAMEQMLRRIDGRHSIHWYASDEKTLADLPATSRFPRQIYLRLLMPSLISQEIGRLIWVDSDVLIEVDLLPLWTAELGDCHTAAVRDFGYTRCDEVKGMRKLIDAYSIKPDSPYFNSGVVMMDLSAWRAENIGQRVIDCIAGFAGSIRFPDQDAMNAVCSGRWLELDRRWNSQVAALLYFVRIGRDAQPAWFEEQRARLIEEPWIIHFTTAKPWDSAMFGEGRRRYFRYLRTSGFLSSPRYFLYKLISTLRTAAAPLHRHEPM